MGLHDRDVYGTLRHAAVDEGVQVSVLVVFRPLPDVPDSPF